MYAKAYSYWDANASQIFTQQWLTQISQEQDQASGKVTSYTIAPQIQYPDEKTAIATLTVTRSSGESFHVELHLRPVGGEWRIFSSTTTNA